MEHMDRKIIPMLYHQRENDDQNSAVEKEIQSVYKSHAIDAVKLPTRLRIGKESVFLKRTELYDSRVTIALPRSLRLISEKEASMKYPSSQRPEWIYTNDSGTVNFTFNRLEHRISEEELTSFTETMANVIRGTQPIREWEKHGVRMTETGQVVGYCQFSVQGLNNQIYNHIVFSILERSVLVYGFNCTDEERRDWLEPAETMLNSLAIH